MLLKFTIKLRVTKTGTACSVKMHTMYKMSRLDQTVHILTYRPRALAIYAMWLSQKKLFLPHAEFLLTRSDCLLHLAEK